MEKEKEKNQEKPAPTVNGKSKQRRLLRKKAKARAVVGDARSVVGGDNLSSLPPPFQNKLQGLFMQIEKEFERLHNQNNACRYTFSHSFTILLTPVPLTAEKEKRALRQAFSRK